MNVNDLVSLLLEDYTHATGWLDRNGVFTPAEDGDHFYLAAEMLGMELKAAKEMDDPLAVYFEMFKKGFVRLVQDDYARTVFYSGKEWAEGERLPTSLTARQKAYLEMLGIEREMSIVDGATRQPLYRPPAPEA